jgi:hypothetical protein
MDRGLTIKPKAIPKHESNILNGRTVSNSSNDTESRLSSTEMIFIAFKFEKSPTNSRQNDTSVFEDADEDSERQTSEVSHASALDMLASSALENGRSISNDTFFTDIDFEKDNRKIGVSRNALFDSSIASTWDETGPKITELSGTKSIEGCMNLMKKTSKANALELSGNPTSKIRPLPAHDTWKSMALVASPKTSVTKTDFRDIPSKSFDSAGQVSATVTKEAEREIKIPNIIFSEEKDKVNGISPIASIHGTSSLRNIHPVNVTSSEKTNGATFIREEDIRDADILSGRGGKSNHHVGNKRFRQVVSEMKSMYRSTGQKTDKTALSKGIVEYVHSYGGRFLIQKKVGNDREWHLMSKAEARKKTSQALRETKVLKWTLNIPNSVTKSA